MSVAIENLAKDEKFMAKLENARGEDEVVALFKSNGVEITANELKAMLSDEKGELDESSLDEVSGGAVAYIIGYAAARWLKNRSSLGGGKGAFGGGGAGSR